MRVHDQRLVESFFEAEAAGHGIDRRQHITSRAVAVAPPGPEVLVLADDHARRRRVLERRRAQRHLSDALAVQEDLVVQSF